MKTIKLKHICLSVLICVFVLGTFTNTLVHAAKTTSGVERLQAGIENYENGKYDDAIFNLEMAKIQISKDDKESLWKVHFYLGLSYYLIGENEDAKKEFSKVQGLIENKYPESEMYSPKIVKLFKEAITQKKHVKQHGGKYVSEWKKGVRPAVGTEYALSDEEFEKCWQIYFGLCAGCHGVLRRGATGPNLTPAKMIPKGKKKLRDMLWYGTAKGMPGWGIMGVMTAEETDLMVKYIQNEPPQPPQWDMQDMRKSWKVFVQPEKRPTKPEHNRDIDNMFVVVLRDAGKVAIIDGDTKEVISTVDSGYGIHVVKMSMSGRYVYTIGRDGKCTLIDLWMRKPDTVAEVRAALDARSIEVSKFKGFEDKYAVVGGYWPPQIVILDGETLEPLKMVSTLGYTYDTKEYHPRPRVAGIAASHIKPEWVVNIKETGKVWFVDYSDVNNPSIKKIGAERFLHQGGWDSTKRYFLVPANARNKVAIIDAKEQRLVALIKTGGIKPHSGRGANWIDPEFGPVWATGHIGDNIVSIIGTDPVNHPEYAFKMVAEVQALSSGNLFIKTHPKSKWVWVDHPVSKKEVNRTTLGIFDKANIKAGIFKTLKVADYGKAVHLEYNKAGDEIWVSIWGNLGDADKGKAGEIVVIDDATMTIKTRIPNLLTPTGKFNVYNTMHDIY